MAKRCWRCAEPLDPVTALAALASGRILQAHACAPVDMETPGAHRIRSLALADGCLLTVMAHIRFR